MKPSLVQQACPTAIGTVNFTDSSVASNLVAAIAFSSDAAANSTLQANAKFNIGAWDLANKWVFGAGMIDATPAATAVSGQEMNNAYSWARVASSGLETVGGTPATLSNGLQLAINPADGGAYLINMLMMAGGDFAVGCSTGVFNTTDTTKTWAHNCGGGTPGMMIFVFANETTAIGTNSGPMAYTIGLWDGANSVGFGIGTTQNLSPTEFNGMVTNDLGHWVQFDVDQCTWSFSGLGSTNITVSRTAANSQAATVAIFALRGTSSTLVAKAVRGTLPTSTGNFSPFTGMAAQPQVSILFPTRLQSTALATDDTSGSFGMCVSVNNNGTTQQMSVAATIQDNVSTTVSKCQTFNANGLSVLGNTGSTIALGTLNTWNSDGNTYNIGIAFSLVPTGSGANIAWVV